MIGPGSEPPLRGLRITSLTAAGPAAHAGLGVGDVIIGAHHKRPDPDSDDYDPAPNTSTVSDLQRIVAGSRGLVWLTVVRGGRYGQFDDIRVDLRH